MRAIRRSRYGGPETLEVADVDPEPLEPGRVRLRVTAASLNPFASSSSDPAATKKKKK